MSAYETLLQNLETIARRWRRTYLWRSLWSGFLVLIAILLAVGAVDLFFLPLPNPVRIGLFALLALTFLIGPIITRQRRPPFGPEAAARLVERQFPQLHDRLISAIDCGKNNSDDALSGYMVEQLLQETAGQIQGVDMRQAIERRPVRRRAWAGIGLVAGIALMGMLFPTIIGVELGRLFNPWRSIPPVRWTQIAVAPGDTTVLKGSDQTILATLSGHSVEKVFIHLKDGVTDPWRQYPMEALENDLFSYELFDLASDHAYYVSAGDGLSATHHLQIFSRPQLEHLALTYSYPHYTGLDQRTQEGSGHIRAVVGTQIQLQARFTKTLAQADLCLDNGDSLQAATIDDSQALFSFTLTDSARYHFCVSDMDGYRNEPGRTFAIHAIPDQPPIVRIPEPGGDTWAIPADEIQVKVEARDDFGLRDLTMHAAFNDQAERHLTMSEFDLPGVPTGSGDYTFTLGKLKMQPGEIISYYAEANDWNGGHTLSDLYLITIRGYREDVQAIGSGSGTTFRLSSVQAAILQDTWRLARRPVEDMDAAIADLTDRQVELQDNLHRLLTQAGLTGIPDALGAANAMSQATKELDDQALEAAVLPEKTALSYLLKIAEKLPKVVGNGDGDGDSDSAPPPQLEEVANDFREQESDRRRTQLKRAQDLLQRAKKEQGSQIRLNQAWQALSLPDAEPDTEPNNSSDLVTQQQQRGHSSESLAADIGRLENDLEAPPEASDAVQEAAGRMFEASALGGNGQADRAWARGVKARVGLEKAIDALFPLMVRHAGEWIPLLAQGLEYLAARQETLAQDTENLSQRDLPGIPVKQRQALVDRQKVMPEAAVRLCMRLEEAAQGLESLAPDLAAAAAAACESMEDALVEERMRRAIRLLQQNALPLVVIEGRQAAADLRRIAAQLKATQPSDGADEGEGLAQALKATQEVRDDVAKDKDPSEETINELEALYAALDDERLQETLNEALGALGINPAAGQGGSSGQGDSGSGQGQGDSGGGPGNGAPALAALDQLIAILEDRLARLEERQRLAQMQQEGYPPAYRELVEQYYRKLAEAGALQ